MAEATPIILFGGLVIFAIIIGGTAMDMAAANRKAQQGEQK